MNSAKLPEPTLVIEVNGHPASDEIGGYASSWMESAAQLMGKPLYDLWLYYTAYESGCLPTVEEYNFWIDSCSAVSRELEEKFGEDPDTVNLYFTDRVRSKPGID